MEHLLSLRPSILIRFRKVIYPILFSTWNAHVVLDLPSTQHNTYNCTSRSSSLMGLPQLSDQSPASRSLSSSHLASSLLSPGPPAQCPQMLGKAIIWPTPSFIFATSISESSGLHSMISKFYNLYWRPLTGNTSLSLLAKRAFLL
jgi:hypothetical protein